MNTIKPEKPLGYRAYGHIPHLPGSRMGPGDHHCHQGQSDICTKRVRDKHDRVIIQEKYDGSCVSVARIGDEIMPLIRAGYRAVSSKWLQHRYFDKWCWQNRDRFLSVLKNGERLVGEWLAQAHGTRYEINCIFEPFIAFDIMRGQERMPFDDFTERLVIGIDSIPEQPFCSPHIVGYGPMSIGEAMSKVCNPWAKDQIEGVVYRVERLGKVDFLAKFVRPDKIDGCYLPEVTGQEPIWNWRPSEEQDS